MIFPRMIGLSATTYVDFHPADQDLDGQDPPPWTRKTKIVASKDEVSSILLAWAGLYEVWHEHALGCDRDFLNDVVLLCDGTSIDVEAQDEPALMPDEHYAILINEPEVARNQMVAAVEELIAQREDI